MKVLESTLAIFTLLFSSQALTTYALPPPPPPNPNITINSSQELVVTSNNFSQISAYDESQVKLKPGSDLARLYAYDNSHVSLETGSVLSWLYARNNTKVIAHGGDLSWLFLLGNSSADIHKIDDLSWLNLLPTSKANIYGSNFKYSNGHLSGLWADGSAFSFWALQASGDTSPKPGIPTNTLPQGINLRDVSRVPEIDGHSFPLSLALILGIISLIRDRRVTTAST